MLGEISVTVKHGTPDKESFSRVAKFYTIDGEQKKYASFRHVCGLGFETLSEMLETMQENDLFNIFPEFSKVVHILIFLRAIIQCIALIENLRPQQRMGQQRVNKRLDLLKLKGHMPTL